MKDLLKYIIFLEVVAMFACGLIHLVAFLTNNKWDLLMYPLFFGVALLICLFVVFILTPLIEWFYEQNNL